MNSAAVAAVLVGASVAVASVVGSPAAAPSAVGSSAVGSPAAGSSAVGSPAAGSSADASSAGGSSALMSWTIAEPGRGIVLPADHVSHPDYKVEWWYYTGNLDTREGRRFGYQLTFFRVGVNAEPPSASRWAVRDLFMAHFAVSDVRNGRFHAFDRLQRAGAGWAGAATDRYRVWNGQWSVSADAGAEGAHHLQARDNESGLAIDLRLTNTAHWVLHGEDGYSRKGGNPSNASEYYSLPRLATQGTLAIDGQTYEVAGASWMDHEFGSSVLEADQIGWDWFGLQLDDGRDIMLYRMRHRDGSRDPFSSGTILSRDGRVVHLTRDDYTLEPRGTWPSPETGTTYPIRWHVTLPKLRIDLDVQAVMPDQELNTPRSTGVTYWEGAVDVSGSEATGETTGGSATGDSATGDSTDSGSPNSGSAIGGKANRATGRALRGRGYLELTGYNGVPLSNALR